MTLTTYLGQAYRQFSTTTLNYNRGRKDCRYTLAHCRGTLAVPWRPVLNKNWMIGIPLKQEQDFFTTPLAHPPLTSGSSTLSYTSDYSQATTKAGT